MLRILSKSILLLTFAVVICCGIYPLALWIVGQTFFPVQANGSLIKDSNGQIIGSKLIAQPFTKDEYFQPRPSAASYDASASASSALAASNYALRNRVATTLGTIVKYRSGPKAGQLVAPDIEAWFKQDKFQGAGHIVARWANAHNSLAQAWVNADASHSAFIDNWSKSHPDTILEFIKNNPNTSQPKAVDLVVVFFNNFAQENPGKFPVAVTNAAANGKTMTVLTPVTSGADIQSLFFDMWRQDHPDVELQDVPGDMVTTSGSGLDPHITLQNAEYQLDRVAAKWASLLKRDPATIKNEINQILQTKAHAPFCGLIGERLVNVLEVNLALNKQYGH